MFLLRDTVDSGTDLAKASHILKTFRGGLDSKNIYLTERELTAYLNHVRTLKPKLTIDMEQKIIKFYEKMRTASANEVDCLPIGTRQLEAIVRLSQAHAKLFFRETIQDDDVDCVTELLKDSFKTFGLSVEDSGGVNADITGFRTSNLSKEKTANIAWKSCEDENGSVYLVLFKKELIKSDSFDEESASKWISNWERESIILKNPNGTWRKL